MKPDAGEKKLLAGLKAEFECELRDNILAYWPGHAKDSEYGGYYGLIDNNNIPRKTAPKGLVMHARFLWTYSAAYRIYKYQPYLHAAMHSLSFLDEQMKDERNGGYFWRVSYDGPPEITRKYVYGQAFAIYGLSEFCRAGGPPVAKDQAMELFGLLEQHARDADFGGYYEALEEDWTLPESGKANLGDEDPDCVKSMNTNLHVLEAYTNLYRMCKSAEVRKALERLINDIFGHIIDAGSNHLVLFFDREWKHTETIHSYGHDIEASWLLWEALSVLDDDRMKEKYHDRILAMADTTLLEGLNADFSLNNEKKNGNLDTDRHWWPQAEAIIGLFNAWEMSGETRYLEPVPKIWDFIKTHIRAENGDWYWGRKADGSLMRDEKGGIWKTPYHNGRLCMEMVERIDHLLNC
ncbi:MAG: AGE family epimerase/isomerase [Spirochaetales bacterium]|nr:AGE family epimerase/isomerase [Spirochaetales bacterium]